MLCQHNRVLKNSSFGMWGCGYRHCPGEGVKVEAVAEKVGQYDELDLWLPIEFSQLGHLECTDNKSQLDSSLHKVENLYSCNAKSLRPPVFRGYCLRLNCRHCTQTFHNVLRAPGNSK